MSGVVAYITHPPEPPFVSEVGPVALAIASVGTEGYSLDFAGHLTVGEAADQLKRIGGTAWWCEADDYDGTGLVQAVAGAPRVLAEDHPP
jgi:hypothetical protein